MLALDNFLPGVFFDCAKKTYGTLSTIYGLDDDDDCLYTAGGSGRFTKSL